MEGIGIGAVTQHFGVNPSPARTRLLPFFEDQNARAFADHKTIPALVERSAGAFGVVVPRRQRPHRREPAHAQRRHTRLGAPGNRRIEISVTNSPESLPDPMGPGSASARCREIHALGSESHRDLRRRQIADQLGDKEWRESLQAGLQISQVSLFDRLQPPDPYPDNNADALGILVVDHQSRIFHCPGRGPQTELDESVHLLAVLLGHKLIDIEIPDFGGNLAGMVAGVESSDPLDPRNTVLDRLPAGLHLAAQGAHEAHSGHRDAPSHELIAPHSTSLGKEARKEVSSGAEIAPNPLSEIDASAAGLYHPIMSARIIIGLLALLVAANGCSSKRLRVPAADEVYARGTMAHDDESYEAAIREYRFFLDHYPLDPRAEEVERRVADAYFEDGMYPEAIATYGHFQHMHPTSADQALIEYRIGEAYRLQMDTVDRDLASAQNAHERYRNLALRFPNTAQAQKARDQLAETREHLAERELYVAEFYADNDQYRAAATRAGEIVLRFPDTTITEEAVALLQSLAVEENDQTLDALSRNALEELEANNAIADPDKRSAYAGPALQLLRLHLEQFKTQPAAARTDD